MRLALALVSLLASAHSNAECDASLPVKGVVSVERCAVPGPACVNASEAMYKYVAGKKDTQPDVLHFHLHGSPWRMYGAGDRIRTVEDLAAAVRQHGNVIKRVVIMSSWSGTAASGQRQSLAKQLSAALGGMPVTGQNGFVWYDSKGSVHVTRQAFTVVEAGQYNVPKNGKVMASLVLGSILTLEEQIAKSGDGEAMVRVGAAADAYLLCPARALKAFEAAAVMGSPVGAYNAAMMRLERGETGDREAAIALLKQSAAAGDGPAKTKLGSLEGR